MNLAPLTQAARSVDELNLVLTLLCAVVSLGVVLSGVYFLWKYHVTRKAERSYHVKNNTLEVGWTIATLVIFLAFFFWGVDVYKRQVTPVKPDYEIYVFAKRWMWKFHHPTGLVEINHLHLPAEKNVRLTMVSEDVIHSFFVPALRIKQDVLPAYLTALNLRAERLGDFPLHCAEYCGTYHSRMGGKVTTLSEENYRSFVGLIDGQLTLAQRGKKLFETQGCVTCHSDPKLGPRLQGLTDDLYIRESILYPEKVKRFQLDSEMPSFKGALTEAQLRALTEYVKELR